MDSNQAKLALRRDITYSLFVFLLTWSCLLAFIYSADANYRKDGRLGITVPPDQIEILAGTAPAPYVYRQGVPQIRRFLQLILKPGHAALLVDSIFAVIAMAASAYIAAIMLGRRLALLGVVLATISCMANYPNDKPESVASVAVVSSAIALCIANKFRIAALVAVLGATIRPEFPIILGLALLLPFAWHRRSASSTRNVLWPATMFICGLVYLLVAKYVLWPEATYPRGVPVVMLSHNFTNILAFPGTVLGLGLCAFGVLWLLLNLLAPESYLPLPFQIMVGMGMFICLYAAVILIVAKSHEIRVFQPIIPLVSILGLSRVYDKLEQPDNKGARSL